MAKDLKEYTMKNYVIENLFPTPIYCATLDNFEELEKELDSVLPEISFYDTPSDWGKTHKVTENKFEDNLILKYGLNLISEEIYNHVKVYCKELGSPFETYTMSSWLTLLHKGDYGQTHNHGWTDISGVYYYKTNENDGSIFFESPAVQASTSRSYISCANRWKHDPKRGKLMLFPGWLEHGVTMNTTDSKRLSLSFNINFLRK